MFDIQALYRSDQHQVTIWATLTSDTPRTTTALLDDPRTDPDRIRRAASCRCVKNGVDVGRLAERSVSTWTFRSSLS